MRVGLVGNRRYRPLADLLSRLAAEAPKLGVELVYEPQLADLLEGTTGTPLHDAQLDIILSLGGDGTLLRSARIGCLRGIPVFGINLGRLGFLAGAGPDATRLATFGPGQFVGEMGFIDGNARSATVTADTAVSAVLLDKQALEALVQDHPQAALKITRNIARELAHRVRSTSAVLVQEASAPQSAWGTSVLGGTSK